MSLPKKLNAGLHRVPVNSEVRLTTHPVFENTYFSFFFRFQKNNYDFTFFEMTFQKKRKKSQKVSSLLFAEEILASKLRNVIGTYRHLSHTVLSCIVSCVRIPEQDV